MVTSSSVSNKMQSTLNNRLMHHLGVKAEEVISTRPLPAHRLEIEAKHNKMSKAEFLDLMDGHFKTDDVLSIEQINEAVADAATHAGYKQS